MKPSRGPNAPSQPRTLRGHAIDRGTDAGGFPDPAVPYDPAAGTPEAESGGRYASNVPDGGATPSAPLPDPSPFKLGPQ